MTYPFVRTWWIEPGKLLGGQYPCTPKPDEQEAMLEALLETGVNFIVNLQHWKKGQPRVNERIMGGGYHAMRGNFCSQVEGRWNSLTVLDACKLSKHPFFAERKLTGPYSGVSKKVGMRGARQTIEIAAAFAARRHPDIEYPKPDPALPDATHRIIGAWALASDPDKLLFFHADGTATVNYDNDPDRRWIEHAGKPMLTRKGAKGGQKAIFLADGAAVRLGSNIWLRVPAK